MRVQDRVWVTLAALTVVLQMQRGASAAVITPVSDFASSYYSAGQTPANLINDSRLVDASSNPVTPATSSSPTTWTAQPDGLAQGMWHAGGGQGTQGGPPVVSAQYVVFDLGANYNLTTAYLWEMNQTNLTGRGIEGFELLGSSSAPSPADAANPPATYNLSGFTPILSSGTLAEADGVNNTPAQTFSLSNAFDVRQVYLEIFSDYNGLTNDYVGLSEIKFDGVLTTPEPRSVVALLGLCGMGLIGLAWRRPRIA